MHKNYGGNTLVKGMLLDQEGDKGNGTLNCKVCCENMSWMEVDQDHVW